MKFNFHFGKKKASLKTIVILTLLVAALAGIFKIEEVKIWDIVYETILHFDPDSALIPELQKDPGIIERKAERTVDKAIREYEDLTGDPNSSRIPLPRLIETSIDTSKCYTEECKKLGGEMRICSPWVPDCIDTPKTISPVLPNNQSGDTINKWEENKPLEH